MMVNTVSTLLKKTILVSRMTHSMSDVSFRKRVSNVEVKGGKISLTRKKHSEDVGEGLALSSVCRFSTSTCSWWQEVMPLLKSW